MGIDDCNGSVGGMSGQHPYALHLVGRSIIVGGIRLLLHKGHCCVQDACGKGHPDGGANVGDAEGGDPGH